MSKKSDEYSKKWKKTFGSTWGKPGAVTGNAIAVEIDGVRYDSLSAAAEATGKSISWIKRNGKLL